MVEGVDVRVEGVNWLKVKSFGLWVYVFEVCLKVHIFRFQFGELGCRGDDLGFGVWGLGFGGWGLG